MQFAPSRARNVALFCTCCLILAAGNPLCAQNWDRFRGENGTGVSSQKGIPVTWKVDDYSWRVELPGIGHAAPIIHGNKLFTTSASEGGVLRHLFCLNAATGERNWVRTVGMSVNGKHQKNSFASSTPATDGERVYVGFADEENFLFSAYDYSGNLVWRRNLGAFTSSHGLGASPVIFGDMVIMTADQEGPSSIWAFNRKTGETVWTVARGFRRTSYATPMFIRKPGETPQLICLSGATGLTSLNPFTGKLNWNTGELMSRTVASPVFDGKLLFATCGGGGKGHHMIAVDPRGTGDVAETHIVYERLQKRKQRLPYVPTMISHGDHLYLWKDDGIAICLEADTGKDVWVERVPGAAGNYSGSPVVIDGKLYCVSERGEVAVIDASPTFKFHGRSPLGDASHSTPAVAQGRLYLRSFHFLACLESTP